MRLNGGRVPEFRNTTNNTEEHPSMTIPTIVLVHGAFADASSWQPLFAELDGSAVLAPPNPLRGLATDAAYLRAFVERIDGPVLLVGHSYGGALITVAGAADNVVGLVYVAGFAPDEGETINAVQAPFPAPAVGPYIRPSAVPGSDIPEVSIDPAHFHEVFAADLPAATAAFMAIAQRPLSAAAFDETVPTAAWRIKPSWAVLPTADGAIDPGVHRWSYERIGATVTEVDGASHAVMASQPAIVAAVVREALAGVATA
jgi:pimeloyl-ACP methyl ester carboxylesterase